MRQLRHAVKRLCIECEVKKPGLLCQRVEWRYAVIAEPQETWPVSVQGEVLEVSRSGFYDDIARQEQPTINAEDVML